jgi:hypothetical protein
LTAEVGVLQERAKTIETSHATEIQGLGKQLSDKEESVVDMRGLFDGQVLRVEQLYEEKTVQGAQLHGSKVSQLEQEKIRLETLCSDQKTRWDGDKESLDKELTESNELVAQKELEFVDLEKTHQAANLVLDRLSTVYVFVSVSFI